MTEKKSKNLRDTSPKKICSKQISMWKNAPHPMPKGNANQSNELSLQSHYNDNNPRHWQHQMLTRMWGDRSSLPCQWKCTKMCGKTVCCTMLFKSLVSWYLPKVLENLCPHENLHRDVYSNFIHNCPNLEVTKFPSVGEWRNCISR